MLRRVLPAGKVLCTVLLACGPAQERGVPGESIPLVQMRNVAPGEGELRVDVGSRVGVQFVALRMGDARIAVNGDGDTDVDCVLRGARGPLASDTDQTDTCLLGTAPQMGDTLMLVIENRGSVWNSLRVAWDSAGLRPLRPSSPVPARGQASGGL